MRWIERLFSPNQMASFGRVGCAVIITSVLSMDIIILFRAKEIPTSPPDIPFGWVSVLGLLWGGAKITEAYINKQAKQPESETTDASVPISNK